MSAGHAVFVRLDGSAELRAAQLGADGRPLLQVMLPRWKPPEADRWASPVVAEGETRLVEYRLTDEGVDFPIYREVTP